jgi:peroxiredoxin
LRVDVVRHLAKISKKENKMSRVLLNQLAPNFSLPDYAGNRVSLSDFLGRKNVLLVFNRTFA